MGKQFYKFTSVSARSMASIVTGKFWAASLDKMNDPFEEKNYSEGFEKDILDSCGVICFSKYENKTDNIIQNPLMWAHYAKNHEGIAIGLIPKKENNTFAVEYKDFNEINNTIDEFLKDCYDEGNLVKMIPIQKIFFQFKENFWRYEKEHRQVWAGSANQYVDPGMNINEVIFGFRSKLEDELVIWNLLQDKIKYRKVININGKLEIINYDPKKEIVTSNTLDFKMDYFNNDVKKYLSTIIKTHIERIS